MLKDVERLSRNKEKCSERSVVMQQEMEKPQILSKGNWGSG